MWLWTEGWLHNPTAGWPVVLAGFYCSKQWERDGTAGQPAVRFWSLPLGEGISLLWSHREIFHHHLITHWMQGPKLVSIKQQRKTLLWLSFSFLIAVKTDDFFDSRIMDAVHHHLISLDARTKVDSQGKGNSVICQSKVRVFQKNLKDELIQTGTYYYFATFNVATNVINLLKTTGPLVFFILHILQNNFGWLHHVSEN